MSMAAVCIAMLIFFIACNEPYLAQSQWEWNDSQWLHGDKKTMTMTALDTTAFYKLDLQVNHEETYPYSNLYIRTVTTYPSGKEVVSVTSLELTNPDGTWAGDYGENCCKLKLPLQSRFTFPELGEYSWTVEPYMRHDTVKGITALKVTCGPVKE
jgi:gliding motility-associated lipoprotein GldH